MENSKKKKFFCSHSMSSPCVFRRVRQRDTGLSNTENNLQLDAIAWVYISSDIKNINKYNYINGVKYLKCFDKEWLGWNRTIHRKCNFLGVIKISLSVICLENKWKDMDLVPRTHIVKLRMLEYLQSHGRKQEKGDFSEVC